MISLITSHVSLVSQHLIIKQLAVKLNGPR